MSIKFVRARRIEDLETEANSLWEKGYRPLDGGFIEEQIPDTPEKFILLMVKKPARAAEKAPVEKKKKTTKVSGSKK